MGQWRRSDEEGLWYTADPTLDIDVLCLPSEVWNGIRYEGKSYSYAQVEAIKQRELEARKAKAQR